MKAIIHFIARILIAQIFLVQFILLSYYFSTVPTGYEMYQAKLGRLPGIFAPLILLIQCGGGASLLLGFKTRLTSIVLAVFSAFLIVASLFWVPEMGISPLQYLALMGGLLLLSVQDKYPYSLDAWKKK